MYIAQTYTFAPGDAGVGTITIPEVLKLEDFGVIINVTRNSVIYDPAEGQAGGLVSYNGGNTVLTLEQSTTYCQSGDKLQIAILPEIVGGEIPVLCSTDSRTPTTTRVASSASSVLILAANASRKGFSLSNISTSNLYLSFTNPATIANCFIEIPGSAFILLDQQLIVPNAIYGLWDSANGAAQVTEFV